MSFVSRLFSAPGLIYRSRGSLLIPNNGPYSDQSLLNAYNLPSTTFSGLFTINLPQSRRDSPLLYNKITFNLNSINTNVRPNVTQGNSIFMRCNELNIQTGNLNTNGFAGFIGIKNESPGGSGGSGGGASGNFGSVTGADGGDGGVGDSGETVNRTAGGIGTFPAYDQVFFDFDDGGDGGNGSDSTNYSGGLGGTGSITRGAGRGGGGAGNEGQTSINGSTGGGGGGGLIAIVGRALSYGSASLAAMGSNGGTPITSDFRGGGGGGGVIYLAFLAKLASANIFSVSGGTGFQNGGAGSFKIFEISSDFSTLTPRTEADTWDNR